MSIQQTVFEYESVTWMKEVHAVNTDKKYFTIGIMRDMFHTLLVTLKGGNGGALFYCETHKFAYPISEKCGGCQNAVVEAPIE